MLRSNDFTVPALRHELMEAAGGFLLESDPPIDVKGWVIAVGFYQRSIA